MINFRRILSFWLLMAVLSVACSDEIIYKESTEPENAVWTADFVPTFQIPVSEPDRQYDMYLQIEAANDFRTQNLWMFYQIEAPDGSTQNDTVEYNLFDEKGRPYGKTSGDEIIFELLYKAMVSFPEKGTYTLRAEQGMRLGQEPLVSEISLLLKPTRFSPEKPSKKE
jgi:gliding motility-associated lipoprotein GldH